MLGLLGTGLAQGTGDKIAFVNLEGVLSLMPEYNAMLKSVQIYERKLAERLQVKQNYLEDKIQEYVDAKKNGATEADLKVREDELRKLDKEIKDAAQDADNKIAKKRVELLLPITDKLKTNIVEIAKTRGYTYVLNSVDGTQTSILLNMSDENDLTKALLDKLGISYPEN
ncbi:MAG: OmpH family outer membrane protein [Bacteroidia bacterium]